MHRALRWCHFILLYLFFLLAASRELTDTEKKWLRVGFETAMNWSQLLSEGGSDEYPVEKKQDDTGDTVAAQTSWKNWIHKYVRGSKALWWSHACYGFASPWETCRSMCYTERFFYLTEGSMCPEDVYLNMSRSVKICSNGACPLSPIDSNPILRRSREAMFTFEFHNKVVENLTEFSSLMQFPLNIMLLSTICVVAWFQHFRLEWLPDVAVAVPVASAFAIAARWGAFQGVNFGLVMDESFGAAISTLMNHVLLPITIYTGAYTVQRKNLFAEFASALVFAVVGTTCQICLVAIMVKYSGEVGLHCVDNWRESFAYASFVADVDPVTTLSIFAELKVSPLLQTLASGEGLLNDPIALVIFGMLNKPTKTFEFDLVHGSIHILNELIFSTLLGLFLGFTLTKLMSLSHIPGEGALERIYVFSCAYVSYSLGDYMNLSGIIVCLFCGFIMGIFVEDIATGAHEIETFLHVSAQLAELAMFFLVGLGVFLLDHMDDLKLGALTIPFCILARGITIAVLVRCLNFFRARYDKERGAIDFGTAFMLFHSNLRGGITLMMALQLDASWSVHQSNILGSTIISMMILNYLGGMTAPFFMRLVKVPFNVPQVDGALYRDTTEFAQAFHLLRRPIRAYLGKSTLGSASNDEGTSPACEFEFEAAPSRPSLQMAEIE